MTADPKPNLADVHAEALEFHRAFDSLLLATVNAGGNPEASYAPYVADGRGSFYIYISELAAHTANLQGKPRASVLFIEDESRAQHLFGRKRVTCDCRAEPVPRGSGEFEDTLARFVEKHGKFMEMLKGLKDFHLFRLTPEKANYVRGFAQAYELHGEGLAEIRHVNDKGHKPADRATADAMDSVA
jgi:putative heme iron utilization protein